MAKKRRQKEEFKITVKHSSTPEEEKRKLLWRCFDILFSNKSKKKVIKK